MKTSDDVIAAYQLAFGREVRDHVRDEVSELFWGAYQRKGKSVSEVWVLVDWPIAWGGGELEVRSSMQKLAKIAVGNGQELPELEVLRKDLCAALSVIEREVERQKALA